MLRSATALLSVLALCSCLADASDGPTDNAPQGIESWNDLSPCAKACLTCMIDGCAAVHTACATSEGEGRDAVNADGVDIVCSAAVEAGCGNRHLTETLTDCERLCEANPVDDSGE